jgi:hypothetical protein
MGMDDFLKMDVFFIVATLAVVVLTVLIGFVLLRVYRILGYIERISEEVKEESAEVRADIAQLRTTFKKEGIQLALITRFVRKFLQRFFTKDKA